MTTRLTADELDEALHMMDEKRHPKWAAKIRGHIAALSPPTPEDVARLVEQVQVEDGLPAFETLCAMAARVPGLEMDLANLRRLHGAAILDGSRAVSERDALRERVATLEREVSAEQIRVTVLESEAGEEKARAEAAERRVQGARDAALEDAVAVAEGTCQEFAKDRKDGAATGALEVGQRLRALRQTPAVSHRAAVLDEAASCAAACPDHYVPGKVAERIRALKPKPATPAPAGLLEAVGLLVEAVLDTRQHGDGSSLFLARDSEPGPEVLSAERLERLCAAYDATKGGEVFPWAKAWRQAAKEWRVSKALDGHMNASVFGPATTSAPEPSVTHAAIADALANLITMVEEDDAFNDPAKEPDRYAALVTAKDVLRRVTGGEVPKNPLVEANYRVVLAALSDQTIPLETEAGPALDLLRDVANDRNRYAEKAAKWDAAVERAKNLPEVRAVYRAVPEDESGLMAVVRHVLGLTLDTPPSGPGGGESEETWCGCERSCLDDSGHCEKHGHEPKPAATLTPEPLASPTQQRPRQPTPTPEGTAVGSHVEPVTLGKGPFTMLPDVAARAVERTHRTVTDAQPEPSAPEVAWEGDGVEVLSDGSFVCTAEAWHYADKVLARALAEAKRDGDWARQNTRDVDRDRCNTINDLTRRMVEERADAARKAAESMRERMVDVLRDVACVCNACGICETIRRIKTALVLPLE